MLGEVAVVYAPDARTRSADALRNNMDADEYKHVVLGLIFLKYLSDAFDAQRQKPILIGCRYIRRSAVEKEKAMNRTEVLLEQYKMIEVRRNYFGQLFWQLPSFFVALFALFAGLNANAGSALMRIGCGTGGLVFLLVSWIAHRLRLSQDQCEDVLEILERRLREGGSPALVALPRSKKYGARTATILALFACGLALLLIAGLWM